MWGLSQYSLIWPSKPFPLPFSRWLYTGCHSHYLLWLLECEIWCIGSHLLLNNDTNYPPFPFITTSSFPPHFTAQLNLLYLGLIEGLSCPGSKVPHGERVSTKIPPPSLVLHFGHALHAKGPPSVSFFPLRLSWR